MIGTAKVPKERQETIAASHPHSSHVPSMSNRIFQITRRFSTWVAGIYVLVLIFIRYFLLCDNVEILQLQF